jgi:hypothetical protein
VRRYAIVGPVNLGKSSPFYALTGLYVNAPFQLWPDEGALGPGEPVAPRAGALARLGIQLSGAAPLGSAEVRLSKRKM